MAIKAVKIEQSKEMKLDKSPKEKRDTCEICGETGLTGKKNEHFSYRHPEFGFFLDPKSVMRCGKCVTGLVSLEKLVRHYKMKHFSSASTLQEFNKSTLSKIRPAVTFVDKLQSLLAFPDNDQLLTELETWIEEINRSIFKQEEELKVLFILRHRIDDK